MTLEEQIVEMRKQGYSYDKIMQEFHIGTEKVAKALRNAGLIGEAKSRNCVVPLVKESSKMMQAVTYEDIRALKARVKVGTRIKVRTEKCATIDDEKRTRDPSITRTGTVTSVNQKRFLILKYNSGVVESFLWSDLVAMLRQGRCKVVRW